jgi:hypothetical protein
LQTEQAAIGMEIGTMMDYTLHGTQKSGGGTSYEYR